jgi:hypothetical protein
MIPSDLDVFEQHVENMKSREQEQVRLHDEARTKYETIMHERMVLEDFIYKIKQRLPDPNPSRPDVTQV